jgi:hypothetical protein
MNKWELNMSISKLKVTGTVKKCESIFFMSLIAMMALLGSATKSHAEEQESNWPSLQNFFNATHLIDIKQGSELSGKVSELLSGGFETSQGNFVPFKQWYQTNWTDTKTVWMTEINPNFGVIWGFSTGEKAEKYEISRSMTLGFAYSTQLDKTSYLSIRGTTILGGNLKEKSCTADYGAIGGVQEVNCRLAASTLPPSETLNYLFNEKPINKDMFFIRYTKFF